MHRHQEPWYLPNVDLAAKLQACEIELECTRQEAAQKDALLEQCKRTLEYKEKQIKTQARRQREIERLHKELIEEYDHQVFALKQEIDSIKHSQEQVHCNYMEMQKKYAEEGKKSDASTKLLEAIGDLDRQLRHSSPSAPFLIPHGTVTSGETVDVLKQNCFNLETKLKRLLSGGSQQRDSLNLLEGEVNHSVNVTRYVLDQLMALKTSILRALKRNKEVNDDNEITTDASPRISCHPKSCVTTPHATSPLVPSWFNDWSSSVQDSYAVNSEFAREENVYVDQVKEKISTHLGTLECLIGKVVQEEVLRRNLLSNQVLQRTS